MFVGGITILAVQELIVEPSTSRDPRLKQQSSSSESRARPAAFPELNWNLLFWLAESPSHTRSPNAKWNNVDFFLFGSLMYQRHGIVGSE